MFFSKTDKFYIEMIQYGVRNIDGGVTENEVKKYMGSKGYKLQNNAHFFNVLFSKLFEPQLHGKTQENNKTRTDTEKFSIKSEAFFDLIQYKTNKKTKYAFYIASITLILTVYPLIFHL
jgi:hypothetical protein